MDRKRVLLVTQHPLLRESLRSLPMPQVEVIVADQLPGSSGKSRSDVDADVWIVDASVISSGDDLCRLFREEGAPSRVILVAIDAPRIVTIASYTIEEGDAAAFLENIILG